VSDDKDVAAALAKVAVEGPDPYTGIMEPGPNPGGAAEWKKVVEALQYQPALVRNLVVGPFVVSTCQCPQCGELFVHATEYKHHSHNNVYTACLEPDERPRCYRCLYATAWPQPTARVIEALVHIRWRYGQFLDACEVASQKSQKEQRDAVLRAHDAFWLHGPALLAELERIYGDQLKRAVAAIEGGVSGVTLNQEEPSAG